MQILYENVQSIGQLPFKYYQHDPTSEIHVAPHWHQGIELNYLIAGQGLKFVVEGQTTEYHKGDVWAVNHRQIHSANGPKNIGNLEFGIIIDDNFLQQQLPESKNWQLNLALATSSKNRQLSYQKIKTQLATIRQLLNHPLTDLSRLEILSHFYGLLHELGTNFNQALQTETSDDSPLFDTVMTKINQNYAQDIDANTLADEFHVSLTTLNKQFNYNMQMSANRYLRLIRLMNSRKLLLETDRTIDYIAARCGFSSGKTFNRNFKAWKGLTPSDYRNSFAHYHQIDTNCF